MAKGKDISWMPLYSIQAWGRFYGPYPFGYPHSHPAGCKGYSVFQRRPTPNGIICFKRKYVIPNDPKTDDQLSIRGTFADGVSTWQNLTDDDKEVYNHYRYPTQMSGYNKFLHYYLKENISEGIPVGTFLQLSDTPATYAAQGQKGLRVKDSDDGVDIYYFDLKYPLKNEWVHKGFPDIADTSLAWSDAGPDRTLTIAPTKGSFDYFIQGVKYTKTESESVQITDTEGLWIIYYDGDTLTAIHNPTSAQIEDITLTKCLVAYVYWDATNNEGELIEDRHGISMSPNIHREIHFTRGMTYFNGLGLGDFVISDGNDNEDAQFSISAGQVFDEDIKHVLNAIIKTTGLEVWFRNAGLDWRKNTQAGFSVLNAGAGRVYYDNAGTPTEVTDGKFVLYHIFATSNADKNPISIMGQAQYDNAKDAREGAITEMNSLLLGALPSKEMKSVATIIFQTKDTYGNAVKARVVQTDEGDDYVDWRTAAISSSAPAGDHGALAGLADDDHPAYMLAAGAITDNALIKADGTDGRITQPTGIIIDDSDNVSGMGTLNCGAITSTGNLIVGSDIGIAADSNLLQLTNNALRVNGTVGIGTSATATYALAVEKSGGWVAYFHNTNVGAGANSGIYIKAGQDTGDTVFNLSKEDGTNIFRVWADIASPRFYGDLQIDGALTVDVILGLTALTGNGVFTWDSEAVGDVRIGRSTAQHVSIWGDAGGNEIWGISSSGTRKDLSINQLWDNKSIIFRLADSNHLVITTTEMYPGTDNHSALGSASKYWSTTYTNNIALKNDMTIANAGNIIVGTGLGTTLATAPNQVIGFHGFKAIQAAHIEDAPYTANWMNDGQAVVDAINAILLAQENKGLVASAP